MSSVQSGIVNLIARMVRNSFFIHKAETTTQRKSLERISNFTKFPRFVKSYPIHLGGLDAASFIPKKMNKDRIVLYLHGGAYVAGSVNTHRALIARIARSARCEAIGINYRLAPEHPYPAALEDSIAAYKCLIEKGYKHIFLVGDSAGGGLSIATMLKLREEGLQMPCGAALISPWSDLAMTGESVRTKQHMDPLINPDIFMISEIIQSKQNVDGIFCFSDTLAFVVVNMLKEKGLHIPNDIAVIGYDNTPHARWMSPSITTIHQSINFMGKQSFNLLNKLIHGIELDTFHDIIDVYLVERDTA